MSVSCHKPTTSANRARTRSRCNDLESSNATLERLDRHASLAMIVEFIVVQIGSYV
jgi:hypothetical protein